MSELRILHFNDVYNIEPDPKKGQIAGGAARFVTAVQKVQQQAKADKVELLTVFCGDLLGPSMISTIAEGE